MASVRTGGWLRALQVVSLAVGVVGLLMGVYLEIFVAVIALAPGAAVVALGFLLLAVFAGRAGEEARLARAVAPPEVAMIPAVAAPGERL